MSSDPERVSSFASGSRTDLLSPARRMCSFVVYFNLALSYGSARNVTDSFLGEESHDHKLDRNYHSEVWAAELWGNYKIKHPVQWTDLHVRIMYTNASIPSVAIMQHGNPQNNQPAENQEEQKIADMPKPLVKFFLGEPEVLGVTQLVIGINNIFIGIVLAVSCAGSRCYRTDLLVITGAPFWSGNMFVVAGSLSLAASCKPSVGKVKATLVLNILSSIAAVVTVVILIAFLASPVWSRYYFKDYCAYYERSLTCEGEFSPWAVEIGIGSVILIFTILEFCVSLSTSIFGCKTVCRTSYNDMTVVIYHTTTVQESKPALSADGEVKIH